jgi:glutamyl-tRNA synthetase
MYGENGIVRGRFAPSPTGSLHLGNLRTALIAWLLARSGRGGFIVRMEDLDRVTSSTVHETDQLVALRSIGLDWDGPVVRQSDRFELYRAAIDRLQAAGLVYECFCTRREVQAAAQAPQGPAADGVYPGTCRNLTAQARQAFVVAGRQPALRLDGHGLRGKFVDVFAGPFEAAADDVVLQRGDGVPAYNLAVVVDDAAQSVTDVVRGDDLLSSTPRQIILQHLLGLPTPQYTHVPLVLAPDGVRLAKRHGAVTMADLAARGVSAGDVCARLAASIGIDTDGQPVMAADLLDRFDLRRLPSEPWRLTAAEL